MPTKDARKRRKPAPGRDEKRRTHYLHHKLCPVLDAYQVIGYADKIEQHQTAECRYHQQTVVVESRGESIILKHDVASEHQSHREQYHRLESNASKTGNESFMDFTFIHFVKQVAPVSYQQYLRNQYARKQDA